MRLAKFTLALFLTHVLCACVATRSSDLQPRSYFPPTEFADLEYISSDIRERFSEILEIAGEPVIHDDRSIEFAARLTISTAFRGTEIFVVEQKTDGSITGRAKQFAHKMNAVGPLLSKSNFAVEQSYIQTLRQAIDEHNFWMTDNEQELVGSDGAGWVLEIKDGERYHAIYNWGPSGGPVYEIGSILIEVSEAPHPNLPSP